MTRLIKKIILCADDYAQNEAISEGIITLAEKQRISAISCMVNSSIWPVAHRALHVITDSLESRPFIGLHLNLTFGKAVSPTWQRYYGHYFLSLPKLLKQAYFRQLNRAVLATEIQAQVDLFCDAMNAYPDFIDGHEHCHQLPMIRDALLSIQLPGAFFIRNTSNGYHDLLPGYHFPKRQLITLLGGMTCKRQLSAHRIATNTSFSGIYNFKQSFHYRDYFKQFLSDSLDGGLIMCHPGKASNDTKDPLAGYRYNEYRYFLSDEFVSDLAQHSIALHFKEIPE